MVRGEGMVEEEPGNESEEDKTFKNLVTEVHEKGLCGACGGCVSFCSAGELLAIGFGSHGKPEFLDEDSCLECGICYLICPQIDILDPELRHHLVKMHGTVHAGCAGADDDSVESVKADVLSLDLSLLHVAPLQSSQMEAAVDIDCLAGGEIEAALSYCSHGRSHVLRLAPTAYRGQTV